ncbi:MAG: YihA family ribosome biogenesis GTP-binding protein [Bacteroidia bacterium]|nr:YihA family ribosome biogenesis GTP-binding protein [Bacteroidia bacterium]
MEIKTVKFLTSGVKLSDLPKDNLPEYAFVGRSNVGKSSLINKLVNRQGLARTSSTPGKTQTLNYFVVNESWYLVDLPGYGYAKVSKKLRGTFSKMIEEYIKYRKNLITVFVLVDSRHKPQESDMDFFEFLGKHEIPFVIVFTKTDKLNQSERNSNFTKYQNKLLESWEGLPPVFKTSAETGVGVPEILEYIEENIRVYEDYLASQS